MKMAILPATLALLTSMSGQALASQTYSRTVVTDRVSQQLADDYHVQPGAASSAVSSVGPYRSTATADFGVIKLLADTPDANGLAQATGSFQDAITLSGGGGGGFVPVTLNFLVDGIVTNYNPGVGDWSYQLSLELRGTDQNAFQYVSTTASQITSATGVFTLPVSTSGFAPPDVSLNLTAVFSIYTSGNLFSAFNLDFTHTGLLTGIEVADGTTVTSATYGLLPTNGGAFTYPAVLRELGTTPPPLGVPEPASWVLMIAGFGMVGGALRSTRRALA